VPPPLAPRLHPARAEFARGTSPGLLAASFAAQHYHWLVFVVRLLCNTGGGPMRKRSSMSIRVVCTAIAAFAALGCAKHRSVDDGESGAAGGGASSDGTSAESKPKPSDEGKPSGGNSRDDDPPSQTDPLPPRDSDPDRCAVPENTDKLDLLFMVDNSQSMAQEQAALREQFPHMIAMLTSGDPGSGGPSFPPINDLHLGVVSSDLGLVGISDIDKCSGLGDDGVMQNTPRLASCEASYPRFLTYNTGINTPEGVANDFACISMLGTDGCGFEQQLETTLKALWPGVMGDHRIEFLGDANGAGTHGHGDKENQGFLRNDPTSGLSLIAVVLVTDEDDCSSQTTEHFTPNAYLDPTNPTDAMLLQQGLNVRCHSNPQNLFAVERYVSGLKALRPGHENMVLFSAIVGVPPETVGQAVLESLDLTAAADRDQLYDGIFAHPDMQPVINTNNTPDPQDDTMQPSCDTSTGRAYPPRRIVEVARGFGASGMVQSICQDDFGPAMNAIVRVIGRRLSNADCVQ
jgi:hypothetical protein